MTRARRTPARRDRADFESELRELRAAIGNVRLAAEALAATGTRERERRAALLRAVVEESERASAGLAALARAAERVDPRAAGVVATRRLVAEVARRAEADFALALRVEEVEALRVRIPPGMQGALLAALGRLRRDFGVAAAEVAVRRHQDLVSIEIAFALREPEASRLRVEHAAILAEGEPALAAAARAVGGEAWLAMRRGEARFLLRILLPGESAD